MKTIPLERKEYLFLLSILFMNLYDGEKNYPSHERETLLILIGKLYNFFINESESINLYLMKDESHRIFMEIEGFLEGIMESIELSFDLEGEDESPYEGILKSIMNDSWKIKEKISPISSNYQS